MRNNKLDLETAREETQAQIPAHLCSFCICLYDMEVVVGKRDKISIYGNDYNTSDGTAVRDYIHVSDLADIHLKAASYLLTNKTTDIFNCGYGKGYSVLEVINAANKLYNNSINFNFDQRRPGDSEKLVSNVDKLHQHIDWMPKYNNLDLIIQTAVNWEKKINE